MKESRSNYNRQKRNIIIILTLSIIITFFLGGFNSDLKSTSLNILYGIIIGASIAFGSGFISKKMFKSGNWEQNPPKKYISVLIAITLYIIIDVIIVNIIWFKITQDIDFIQIINSNMFYWVILTELSIGIIIYLIILSNNFAIKLNNKYLEVEKSQEEINRYKYASLKSQVNPHFLFNSLNVLSGIIYKDVDKADEFIGKLADIYRYVLEVQDEEIISISREVTFAENYLYLQSIRFGEQLKYKIDITTDKMVVPMALQIIIENALKHNEISATKPLTIEIRNDDSYLIISNNLIPKLQKVESHELGIANIKSRYKYLSDKEVKVIKTNKIFEVRLPLLNLES